MCRECWKQYHNAAIDTPEIRKVAKDIKMFLVKFPTGAGLHIVLDDWNLKTSDIEWCLQHGYEFGWSAEAQAIALHLQKMSFSERASTMALVAGYWQAP